MTTVKKRNSSSAPQPARPHGFSLIPSEKLLEMYAAMLRCRMLQLQASRSRRGKRTPRAALNEATAAGILLALQPQDTVFPAPGDLSVPFLKGVSIRALLASASAKAPLSQLPHGAEHHLAPPSSDAAVQFALAAGAAVSCATTGDKQIVVAFAHASASEPAAWEAPLRFAGEHNLPALFVRQTSPDAATDPAHSEQLGLPIIPVDASDAVAVYRVASESVSRARLGRGPTLIECVQFSPESGADARLRDPLNGMEKYLTAKGLFHSRWHAGITSDFRRKLDRASTSAQRRK